jgi:hypothetical protein
MYRISKKRDIGLSASWRLSSMGAYIDLGFGLPDLRQDGGVECPDDPRLGSGYEGRMVSRSIFAVAALIISQPAFFRAFAGIFVYSTLCNFIIRVQTFRGLSTHIFDAHYPEC